MSARFHPTHAETRWISRGNAGRLREVTRRPIRTRGRCEWAAVAKRNSIDCIRLPLERREPFMKRIELNSQGDAVRRFFLSLPVDADGSLVELNGQAVARVFGIAKAGNSAELHPAPWTEAKNQRRCELIDKDIDDHLTPQEVMELEALQRQMDRHLRTVAPLPLEDARRLHQELLAKAEAARKR